LRRLLALAFAFALVAGCGARSPSPGAAPRELPPVWRLAEHLAEARAVEQHREWIEPEPLRLQPGSLAAPPGFRLAPVENSGGAPVVARFVADRPSPLSARIEVPIEGGGAGAGADARDWEIRALVRDPWRRARLLVEHAPTPELPSAGWEHATDERSGDRVRFDWRAQTRPGQRALTLLVESPAASDLTVERLTVREAGARDPSIVESAAAAGLHGLVERPVEGARSVGPRGVRRVEPSLLAAGDGRYEWTLAPGARALALDTAVVPRGAGGAPTELRVEIERAGAWQTVFSTVRGAPGDGGGWRPARVALPDGARALRLATRSTAPGRAQVVAWGNPTLLGAPPAARPPNVLLITLDAVRADHLSAYGYARPTSRFIAGLASRGARFDDVTAQRGHTWASTTSLVSGLFPQTSGVIARGARSYPGTGGAVADFARAGYLTARIGSPDLPRGQIPGFDRAEIADFDIDVLSQLEALAARGSSDGRPLFVWLHLANAHYPWRVADEFNRFDPGYTGRFASGLSRDEFHALVSAPSLDERERNHLVALYDGAILQMDVRLGQALARLDDAGFFADSIVAVTADHGTHLGEHGVWFLHSTPWRASLAVPLIIVAPGRVPPGQVIGADRGRVLLVDLGATLLELAGAEAGPLDGVSLRPLLTGAAARLPARTTVTRFQPASYVMVENDRYELFWNPAREPLAWPGELARTDPLPALGLWDRARDPREERDLSSEEPLIAGALRAEAEAEAPGAAPPLSTEARQLLKQAGYADDD